MAVLSAAMDDQRLDLRAEGEERRQSDGNQWQSAVPPNVRPFELDEQTLGGAPSGYDSAPAFWDTCRCRGGDRGPWSVGLHQVHGSKLVDDVSHLPAVISLFRLVRDRPGEVVTFEDVVEASGVAVEMARGQMSALSRHVQSAVGVKGWPIEWSWAPDGTIRYRADSRIAQWLRSALGRGL